MTGHRGPTLGQCRRGEEEFKEGEFTGGEKPIEVECVLAHRKVCVYLRQFTFGTPRDGLGGGVHFVPNTPHHKDGMVSARRTHRPLKVANQGSIIPL